MKHAIIFDIDGTLIDSSAEDDRIYRESVLHVLGDVRLRDGLADYDRVTDSGILLQILADNNLPPENSTIESVMNAFFERMQAYINSVGPFEEVSGARAVLRRIANSKEHRLAFATGGWRRSAQMKLSSAGFKIGDAPLATSDDAIERTGIMRAALSAIDEECASVTYFGDGLWDEKACKELKWSFQPVGPGLGGLESFDGLFTM